MLIKAVVVVVVSFCQEASFRDFFRQLVRMRLDYKSTPRFSENETTCMGERQI